MNPRRFIRHLSIAANPSGCSRRDLLRPSLEQVASPYQRPDLAVGDGATEHPETAIGMDISDAARADRGFRLLDCTRDLVGFFDLGPLDVDDAETHTDLRPQIPEDGQFTHRAMRILHHDMIDMQAVE